MKINLKMVRVMQHDFYEAKAFEEGGKKTFSGTFRIEPDSDNDKLIRKALKEVSAAKWADKAPGILKMALAKNSGKEVCYWEGDTKEYDGYAGGMILTTKRDTVKVQQFTNPDGTTETFIGPLLLNKDKTRIKTDVGTLYRGCYVNVSVDIWPQENKWGKTMRCELLGVQKAKDGDAFAAGSTTDATDFDDLSDLSDLSDSGDSGDGEDLA